MRERGVAGLSVGALDTRKNRVDRGLGLLLDRNEYRKPPLGDGIGADAGVVNVRHERAPNCRCLGGLLRFVHGLIELLHFLREVASIRCLRPRPTLQINLQPIKILPKLDEFLRTLRGGKSMNEKYGRDSVLENGRDEIMALLAIIDRLHEHVGVSRREGSFELFIDGHAEKAATLIVEAPLLVQLRHLLGLATRASEDRRIEPTGYNNEYAGMNESVKESLVRCKKNAKLNHNLERAKEYSHRKIAAALALGIECHLLSAYECTEFAEFPRIVRLLGYLGDDFIVRDGNILVGRLPK